MKYKEEVKYILSILCVIVIAVFVWVVLIYGLAMLFVFLESIHISLVAIVGTPIFLLYAWGFNKLVYWVDKKAKQNEEEE